MILLDSQNIVIMHLKHDDRCCKKFLTINLSVLHYFNDLTKLFSDLFILYLIKFSDISARSSFLCNKSKADSYADR